MIDDTQDQDEITMTFDDQSQPLVTTDTLDERIYMRESERRKMVKQSKISKPCIKYLMAFKYINEDVVISLKFIGSADDNETGAVKDK